MLVMVAVLAGCGKKEAPHAAGKQGGQSALDGTPASRADSEEPPAGFAKHVTPKGRVFWVEREGVRAEYPPEFSMLDPKAQEAWRKARYKVPLSTGFIQGFPREVQATWIERMADGPELEAEDGARDAYVRRRMAEDRAELVRPAPKGFKPEGRRKAGLALIPKSAMIRSGEPFWYRLEIQNVGREPIEFNERPSFWKIGNATQLDYAFFVTPPDGGERKVVPRHNVHLHGIRRDYPFPRHLVTVEEKQRFLDELNEKRRWEVSHWEHLRVTLDPGETLVSRPWQYGNPDERRELLMYGDIPDKPIAGEFRELALREFQFDKPGTYKIKAVYDDSPPKLDKQEEEYIQAMMKHGYSRAELMEDFEDSAAEHLGRVESNSVAIEVYK